MKRVYKVLALYLFVLSMNYLEIHGQNPIIQTMYTADPAPISISVKIYPFKCII